MKEAMKWLENAERDLRDAKFNLENDRFEVAAFLSHQAAEKALKALYVLKFRSLWKIHDLNVLAKKVGGNKSIIKICDSLNPHYIETRYPLDVDYTKEMAHNAFKSSEKVMEWVKERMQKKQ